MKREELMVGDWVMSRRYVTPSRVYATYLNTSDERFAVTITNEAEDGSTTAGHSMDELTPIPITNEILENNGFYRISAMDAELDVYGEEFVYKLETDEAYVNVEVEYDGADLRWLYIRVKGEGCEKLIKYVHELQHALKFFGVEKEIVL
jgi:hypothetical protein